MEAPAAAIPQASMSLHHWATETPLLLFLASYHPTHSSYLSNCVLERALELHY